MKTITTSELKALVEKNTVPVFDVRGDIEYEKGHIPGAKTAPLGSLVFRIAGVMNPDSALVVYSNDKSCSLARDAADRLEKLRMTNVQVYEDGLKGWQDDGNPVDISKHARVHTQGEVKDVRPVIVDRENSYGGAFKGDPTSVEGAGG